ncbi:MAG: FAD-dependent oxidoreductase [Pseudomonadota bacterium]
MNARVIPATAPFEASVETLIVGAGAAGLVAALAAAEAGREVLVLERDAVPAGSTALSAGLIPAAGTRWQRAAGIVDDAARFSADIMAKASHQPPASLVARLTQEAAPTLEWLADAHGFAFSLVDDFDYPGHSRRRMHGLASRSGAALIDALRAAAEVAGIAIIGEAAVETLETGEGGVAGIGLTRPDGTRDRIGCGRLILACNGFGGNRAMVARHMPEIADALWFGHDGNRGEALQWGEALGAAHHHLGAYQGHGNVAHPHGILITWAVIGEGGIQVNREGQRFWNESRGYSEAARMVLGQPGGVAFTIFDGRIAAIARQFADFRNAEAAGAIQSAETVAALAARLGVPVDALESTLVREAPDPFGRVFGDRPALSPPFMGVRVTGALFHTQGGLLVDDAARVRRGSGGVFDNVFAAGGAACGVSGEGDAGYLSGNGLLSAVVLGRIAGAA